MPSNLAYYPFEVSVFTHLKMALFLKRHSNFGISSNNKMKTIKQINITL